MFDIFYLRDCNTAFMKHVFPRFLNPDVLILHRLFTHDFKKKFIKMISLS